MPYTPEQNGMIEGLFGSLKAECVWPYRFANRDQAFRVIAHLIAHHDEQPTASGARLSHAEGAKSDISGVS